MDTMKFLLGATAALLLGAIIVSWQGMKQGVNGAPPDEVARLQQQLADLQKEVQTANRAGNPDGGRMDALAGGDSKVEDYEQQLAEARRKLAEAQAQQEAIHARSDSRRDAQLQRDEEGLIAQKMLENNDDELRRARLISQALLVGRVSHYEDDPQYGGFITFEVLMPEQVQVGSVLGIRRNTGILYRFKVSDVSPEGAIANPVTAIGAVKPQPGDELIFPPLY